MSCLKNLASTQNHFIFHQDLIRIALYLFCALLSAHHNLSPPMVYWQIEPERLAIIAMLALLNYIYEKSVNSVKFVTSPVFYVCFINKQAIFQILPVTNTLVFWRKAANSNFGNQTKHVNKKKAKFWSIFLCFEKEKKKSFKISGLSQTP